MSINVHWVKMCLLIMASLLLARNANAPHTPQHLSHLPLQFKVSCGRANFCIGNEKLTIQYVCWYIKYTFKDIIYNIQGGF